MCCWVNIVMPEKSFPITAVNGEPVKTLDVTDRGLAYGDGVFETLLVMRGDIPLWAEHHERLLKGLVALKINLESQRLRKLMDQVLSIASQQQQDLLVLKIIVTRGCSGRGYQVDATLPSTVITQLSPLLVDRDKHNGVKVHICEHALHPVAWVGLKTLNQLPYVMAAQERSDSIYDEGLLFSTEGQLIEATARNIFIVKNEKIMTPLIETCGVAGIMRRQLIEKVAPQLGLCCEEDYVSKDMLFAADEVFLTNSVTGIWPVIECEQNKWDVGAVTRSLQAMCHGAFV